MFFQPIIHTISSNTNMVFINFSAMKYVQVSFQIIGFSSFIYSQKYQKTKKATSFGSSFWWAHLESNQAPTDYESVALTE